MTYTTAIEVESCIGACMIVRKKAMEDVGLFDEDYFFFLEETDWAYRMKKAGWKSYFVPTAEIFHAQGMSVGKKAAARKLFYRSLYTYFKKWHPYLWPLFHMVIFLRLLANTTLTMLGVIFTLGLNTALKNKLSIYFQLIAWHLKGCPPAAAS
jgi:GT2 family glycosyltransferase